MPRSRNPIPFLERSGRTKTRRHPVPRLDLANFVPNTIPVPDPAPRPQSLLDVQGSSPPDRGGTGPWPPQQEVPDDESS